MVDVAAFFLAEYVNVVTVSAMATTLFLGGATIPWVPPAIENNGWLPFVAFLMRMFVFLYVHIWLRGTLPRLRYDQFMRLGWKVLVPVSLLWILLIFAIRAFRSSGGSTPALIATLVIAVLAVVLVTFLVADRKGPQEQVVELASDYPVPPLDLAVPTRLRHSCGDVVRTRLPP